VGLTKIRDSPAPNLYAEENLYNAVWYAVQLSRKAPEKWLTDAEKAGRHQISKEDLLRRIRDSHN
jgi:hypothetical protein